MLQLTQKLGSGEMKVQEVPMPSLGKGQIMVQNHYSLISAGTEGSTVSMARKGLIGKAKERPQQVKQVIDVFKKQGPVQTYRAVNKKLDAYSPLGYSCSGVVLEVGEGVSGFEPGNLVACAGVGYANHAEVVSVPQNLCVKLEPSSDLKSASYNTLGAIALQGVRQADVRLGESCAVIGLGLLGQLAAQMLKASGVRVVGIDIAQSSVDLAITGNAVDLAMTRDTTGIEEKILDFADGLGVDAVIIAAATSSHDPVNFAGAISRKRGNVVILGAVPTGFDRDPHWYRKELSLKMSCSYGPGRYDLNYEEKGQDYPAAYVRWTENRNMQAFQHMLSSGLINLDYLTTHSFKFDKAVGAFDLVVNKTEFYAGIVLAYDVNKEQVRSKIKVGSSNGLAKVNLSFLGAGSYAQGNLLPNIPSTDEVKKIGVLTNTGTTSKRVAEKFGFEFCTDNLNDVLDERSNVWFIATRHDSHGEFVLKGLKAGKHVFVEKPICLTLPELEEISSVVADSGNQVMIGFNRRFSSLSQSVKRKVGSGSMSMIYRVNAGSIPKDTWIQDKEIGGGRIIGEACHFIDYLTFINGSLPVKIMANSMPDPSGLNDTVNILIQFENGSTGVVAYYANGAKQLAKEYIEIYASGTTAIISDFKEMKIYGKGKPFRTKLLNQDKGQKTMVKKFIDQLVKGGEGSIPYEEIHAVSKATLLVEESLRNGGTQQSI